MSILSGGPHRDFPGKIKIHLLPKKFNFISREPLTLGQDPQTAPLSPTPLLTLVDVSHESHEDDVLL